MPLIRWAVHQESTHSYGMVRSSCSLCRALDGNERGFQDGGQPQYNHYLPRAAAKLKEVRNLRPSGSRELWLKQCPRCDTYYLYRTDYEFLAGGSEDEQFLSRLTDEEAEKYLDQ